MKLEWRCLRWCESQDSGEGDESKLHFEKLVFIKVDEEEVWRVSIVMKTEDWGDDESDEELREENPILIYSILFYRNLKFLPLRFFRVFQSTSLEYTNSLWRYPLSV